MSNESKLSLNDLENMLSYVTPVPVCLSLDYVNHITKLVEWYKDELIVKVLTGDISKYEESVAAVLNRLDHNVSDVSQTSLSVRQIIGIIRSIPKSVIYMESKYKLTTMFDSLKNKSEYVGNIKERKQFVMKLISKKYLTTKGFYVVNGLVNDTDLVVYFDTRPELNDMKLGDELKIKATIVNHSIGQFSKCKETKLNRVVYG